MLCIATNETTDQRFFNFPKRATLEHVLPFRPVENIHHLISQSNDDYNDTNANEHVEKNVHSSQQSEKTDDCRYETEAEMQNVRLSSRMHVIRHVIEFGGSIEEYFKGPQSTVLKGVS